MQNRPIAPKPSTKHGKNNNELIIRLIPNKISVLFRRNLILFKSRSKIVIIIKAIGRAPGATMITRGPLSSKTLIYCKNGIQGNHESTYTRKQMITLKKEDEKRFVNFFISIHLT